jgi:hypothetical protein
MCTEDPLGASELAAAFGCGLPLAEAAAVGEGRGEDDAGWAEDAGGDAETDGGVSEAAALSARPAAEEGSVSTAVAASAVAPASVWAASGAAASFPLFFGPGAPSASATVRKTAANASQVQRLANPFLPLRMRRGNHPCE